MNPSPTGVPAASKVFTVSVSSSFAARINDGSEVQAAKASDTVSRRNGKKKETRTLRGNTYRLTSTTPA